MKPEHARQVLQFLQSVDAKMGEPNKDCMIVCALVEGWKPEDEIWEMEINKSNPTEIGCAMCERKLMMSNYMVQQYAERKIEREQLYCPDCGFKALEDASKNS